MLLEADLIRLRHMRDAACEALSYAADQSRADLDTQTMLARALVRCIEIIGEAASRISQPTRDRCDELPWREMVAMRNWLIHAYFDIDHDKVWSTVTQDLPPLPEQLNKLLAAEDQ